MVKKLGSMRRVVSGLILLATVSFVGLSGCSFSVNVKSGHWETDKNGKKTGKCVESGRDCIIGEGSVSSVS